MPVHRGKDSEGPFYQWGEHGAKYRYTAGNPQMRTRAKALAAVQGRKIKAEGGGVLGDLAKKAIGAVKKHVVNEVKTRVDAAKSGPRTNGSPSVRAFLAGPKGNTPIKSITMARVPIVSGVEKAINLLSLGKWNDNKKKMGYSDVFHLYADFVLTNGQRFKVEKNAVVEITNGGTSKGETMEVPNIPQGLTIAKMFENAEGPSLWVYDPAHSNCQDFQLALLKGSGLLTPTLQTFIKQDASTLLTGHTKKIGQLATNLAGRADIILHGKGGRYIILN